jgi:hypothetical protein
MTRDPRQLLPGHATDSLEAEEQRQLMRAALDDQALFDGLVEQEGLRELLADPAARQELVAALERQTPWERLRAWFEREATLLDLAAVGAVVLAGIVGFGLLTLQPSPTRLTPAAARPFGAALAPGHVAVLLRLPEQQLVPAGIELVNRAEAVFAPGEGIQLRLSLRPPARVALIEESPAGRTEQAWPGLGQAPALVPRPASGGPAVQVVSLEAPAEPGWHRLRLVVAPDDLDLGALSPEALAGAASRLTLVDLRYQVVART